MTYAKVSNKRRKAKIDFSKLPGFGMWKDREDMKDSAKWVEELRERESRRNFER